MYNLYCSVRDESHNDWLITVSLFYCNITTFVTVIYYVHKVLYQLDRAHCPTLVAVGLVGANWVRINVNNTGIGCE